jgi:hypothetical protein
MATANQVFQGKELHLMGNRKKKTTLIIMHIVKLHKLALKDSLLLITLGFPINFLLTIQDLNRKW